MFAELMFSCEMKPLDWPMMSSEQSFGGIGLGPERRIRKEMIEMLDFTFVRFRNSNTLNCVRFTAITSGYRRLMPVSNANLEILT